MYGEESIWMDESNIGYLLDYWFVLVVSYFFNHTCNSRIYEYNWFYYSNWYDNLFDSVLLKLINIY
jgi:hypothetical protein